jgi:hypothetical protein
VTTRLWSILTAVAVVVSAAAATPAAAAPSEPVAAPGLARAMGVAAGETDGQVTVTGTVRRLALTADDGSRSVLVAVVPPDGTAVQVAADDLSDVEAGARVAVSIEARELAVGTDTVTADGGAHVEDVRVLEGAPLAASPGGPGVGTSAASAGSVTAAGMVRRVHLMSAVTLGGDVEGAIDLRYAATGISTASTYFGTSTGGAVTFSLVNQFDAGPYFQSMDPCDAAQVFTFFEWAADAARVPNAAGSGQHVVVQTPVRSSCWFASAADIANGGVLWLNGPGSWTAVDPWHVAQGLGNTLALGFSHGRFECPGLADGSAQECRNAPRGSGYDVMGLTLSPNTAAFRVAPGPLNAAQMDVLGLLNPSNTVFATGPGSVALRPVAGLTGMRFLRFTSPTATYYVEYRGAVGMDADLGSTRWGCPAGDEVCGTDTFRPGVVVHRVDGRVGIGSDTYLVEANAGQGQNIDARMYVLQPGRSFLTEDGMYRLSRPAGDRTDVASVTLGMGPGPSIHRPVGNFESVVASRTDLRVRGWTVDHDTRGPGWIWVSVNGRGQVAPASTWRSDVAAAYRLQDGRQGFDVTLTGEPGTNTVCVTAINVGRGENASLGCRTVSVLAANPIGNFEAAVSTTDGITVSGWALDPDTAASSYVWVEVAGVGKLAYANTHRPDIGRLLPELGSAHGFSTTLTPGPGTHQVCVTAVNVGLGANTSLGCRTVRVVDPSPIGNFEKVVRSPNGVTVTGWTLDPQTTSSIQLRVYVNGTSTVPMTFLANDVRYDVGLALPGMGIHHGFSRTVPIPPIAGRPVCVQAVNVLAGSDTWLGCR